MTTRRRPDTSSPDTSGDEADRDGRPQHKRNRTPARSLPPARSREGKASSSLAPRRVDLVSHFCPAARTHR